ncbi:MAG: MoaD/ThiS family protein [bacterium]
MARVVFPDSLLSFTEGEREWVCPAENYRDLLKALIQRWPGLKEPLDRTAVAIDGNIYQDAFLEPLEPDSEVFFMSRIEGG